MKRMLLVLGCLSLIAGCGGDKKAPQAQGPVAMDAAEQEAWEIDLVEARIEKNEAFMDPQQSPLPEADQVGFEGLDYYFPVKDLRYRVALEAATADTVVLEKRKGDKVKYLRYGKLRFSHGGKPNELVVFKPVTGDGGLWLPFHDVTNGDDTYAGGRYLDLAEDEDGTVDLDFNRAYNPLCAYNPERYNCTLPPPENRLPFAVEAGEKLFSNGE